MYSLRKYTVAAGIVIAAALPSVGLADVSINSRIITEDSILEGRGPDATRISINVSNERIGVCGLKGRITVEKQRGSPQDRILCSFEIMASSAIEGLSPVGLHTESVDCPGNVPNALAVVDLVDGPGVTVTFAPGTAKCRGRSFVERSFTFCTEDNSSTECYPVDRFRLDVETR